MTDDNNLKDVTQELRGMVDMLPAGSRLPSVRVLMARHGAGPATVQRAVARLAGEGLIERRPGRGNFVAERPETRVAGPLDLGWQTAALGERAVPTEGFDELLEAPPEGTIPLGAGRLPEDLWPVSQLAAAAARAARRPGVWGRAPVEGYEALREWLAHEAGARLRAQDVLVAPGGQAALSTAFRALAAPGSPVLFESPAYVGALVAARAAGLRPVPVPTDAEGVRTDLLEEAFLESGARLLYCQPTYANPHGTTLPPERKRAVLEAARAAGAFVVEDDPARDLSLDGEPPPPLASEDPEGHVVYVRSVAKPVVPGLRVAALCARGAALARLRAMRLAGDLFVPGVMQETALEFLSSPAWQRHLRRVRGVLRERRDALVGAVRRELPRTSLAVVPRGGLHLWLRLPEGVDDASVAEELRREGVAVSAGKHWFPAEPPAPHLRIGYAGAEAGVLASGVKVLGGVLERLVPHESGS